MFWFVRFHEESDNHSQSDTKVFERLLSRSAGLQTLMECHIGFPNDLNSKRKRDSLILKRAESTEPYFITQPTMISNSSAADDSSSKKIILLIALTIRIFSIFDMSQRFSIEQYSPMVCLIVYRTTLPQSIH